MLNIAIITDIHNGPDMGTKKGTSAPGLVKQFMDFVSEQKPDVILDLGDRVNHVDRETDCSSLEQVAAFFRELSIPTAHILGNHDVDFLTIEDNERILGCAMTSRSEERDGFTLVYWNADVHMNKQTGFLLRDEDIEWLRQTLENASYPTIIFSHVPLDNGNMNGHFYFDKDVYPHLGGYPVTQGEKIREIMERSGKVILCVNGHAHWNAYSCNDGIHYVTLPSVVEMFPTYPDPNAAWTLLKLTPDQIDIEVFGKTPMHYLLSPRSEDRHWISTLKDYSPVQIQPK